MRRAERAGVLSTRLLGDPKAPQVLQGQVDAAAGLKVLAHVAQNVGQLIGQAQRQRGAVHALHAARVGLINAHDRHRH